MLSQMPSTLGTRCPSAFTHPGAQPRRSGPCTHHGGNRAASLAQVQSFKLAGAGDPAPPSKPQRVLKSTSRLVSLQGTSFEHTGVVVECSDRIR